MDLQTPISQVPLVGSSYANKLARLEIATVADLIHHIPSYYHDFSQVVAIAGLTVDQTVTVTGSVWQIKNIHTKQGKILTRATLHDGSGMIDAIWFGQVYLIHSIKAGDTISLSGQVKLFNGKLAFISPEYELTRASAQSSLHTGRLVPIYPETAGVSSKWLRSRTHYVLTELKSQIIDYLPETIRSQQQLLPLKEALWQIHFPDNLDSAKKARQRLSFDELFLLQITSQKTRQTWRNERKASLLPIDTQELDTFIATLPFQLTGAQQRVVREVAEDISRSEPMNRLLEGDVGSGKTVVAAIAMYIAHRNGWRSILMAPTEILAQQHFATITKLLSPFGISIGLYTSATKTANTKAKVPDIFIGTHALLSKTVTLEKIGFVVVDEQHRFGVAQRALLKEKSFSTGKVTPHFLTMTATPIPRTLALTVYGELDLSLLDELPPGRQRVKTYLVPKEKRQGAYTFITQHVQNGEQAFIICPLIEPSETLATVRSATDEYQRLKNVTFPTLRVGLLHGRQKTGEKTSVLAAFSQGQLDILVATPVVEVGIDIPNATVIVIEAAERFGLAQLHQLRGRVGRGDKQSYCFLFTDQGSPTVMSRLRNLEQIFVGPKLAEIDLQLRGPGDLYGTVQHGLAPLSVASLSDLALIEETRTAALELLKKDPDLKNNPLLAQKLATQATLIHPE